MKKATKKVAMPARTNKPKARKAPVLPANIRRPADAPRVDPNAPGAYPTKRRR
jgi:hypothetical protein